MQFLGKTIKLFFVLLPISFYFLFFAFGAYAADTGQATFNVEQSFDATARSQVSAVLVKTTPSLYFYVEKNWWDQQLPAQQSEILSNLDNLSSEFDMRIYPILTSIFGSEWRPGVDNDNRITIFFHSMKSGASGYFRSADEYIKLQVPDSNEREMIYISLSKIDDSQLKVFVAHEFVHMITFNQKDRINGVKEEVWLNEARADYSSTILGYDDQYGGSNLQRRVKDFLQDPQDSLTEWQESKYDYAVDSVFFHYLVDHYSIRVLSDSIKSNLVGIESINEALLNEGAKENFSQIFTDWTIAIVINDCSFSQKYCYLNQNLTDLRISPTLNFLPLSGNSSLSVTDITKNWSGNWQKIIGGNGDLKLEFESLKGLDFQVPYILFDKNNNYSVKFLNLDEKESGQINVKNFGSEYNSLIIIPSLQTKMSGFDGLEPTYPYTFTASVTSVETQDQNLVEELLAKIDSLKKQIAAILAKNNQNICSSIKVNLYFGISDSADVSCLQQFLKNQGQDIYPEGLVTGNFLSLTKSAVIRFQKKYGIFHSGFVGILTRTKINQILNGQNP